MSEFCDSERAEFCAELAIVRGTEIVKFYVFCTAICS